MKKVFAMCLSFCLLLSCVAASAQTMVNVQEPALYVNGFESVEEVTDKAVTLPNRVFEEGGAAGSAGAMRVMFQSPYANYQPSYGLRYFQFEPGVEYELSMWMKFNNAENIKAPKIQILSYYAKDQNEGMTVYTDETLTTEKSSTFAAGSVYLTAEEAGWTAEDGSVKPGWHKVSVPFSVQKKMLWGAYLDPEKIADYKASFIFRFGATNDVMNNPANFMEDYVASIEAEEGSEEYYKSLYMDISFDDITVKRKVDSGALDANLFSNRFEVQADIENSMLTLPGKTWVSGGADNSVGAVNSVYQSAKSSYQPSYGLRYFQIVPDTEYELSMWIKFNNAEHIKAPHVRALTFFHKDDNPGMVVYSNAELT